MPGARLSRRLLSLRDTARAMSQENVEIVRELWDAYSRGDFDHVLALNDPHVVHITLEEGAVYGSDAVRQNFERWKETWEDLEATVEEVIGVGDKVFVVARIRGRGRASGVEVEGRFFEVYTLRNRKVVRYEEFREKAAALEAVGLSEQELTPTPEPARYCAGDVDGEHSDRPRGSRGFQPP